MCVCARLCVCVSACTRLRERVLLFFLGVSFDPRRRGPVTSRSSTAWTYTVRRASVLCRRVFVCLVVTLTGLPASFWRFFRSCSSARLLLVVCLRESSCVACSVWRAGPACRVHRLLLADLPALALGAPISREKEDRYSMNEERYSFMKDLVPCCVGWGVVLLVSLVLSLSLTPSRYASLFDGTMPSTLAIRGAITRRWTRCRRNCGPRGWIASTIVGALCCERLWWLGGGFGYALLDRTSLVFLSRCGRHVGADLLANAIIAAPVADFDVS